MTNHTDPLTALTALRPDDNALADAWPATERHALRRDLLARLTVGDAGGDDSPLDRHLNRNEPGVRYLPRRHLTRGHQPRRHLPRRRVAIGLVAAGAAAVAVASLVLPGGSPGGPNPAAAAELRRLAVVAGEQGATVGPGQFAYTAQVREQTVDDPTVPPAPGDTRVGDVDRQPIIEKWVAASGLTYIRVGKKACAGRGVYDRASAIRGDYEGLTARQLASLPNDPGRLAAFFDEHPSGDNRGATNRFVIAGDLVRSGLASPRLRAAALRVLADTPGLTVRTSVRDDRGRPATAVDDPGKFGVGTLLFDPTTSTVLGTRYTARDGKYHASGVVLATRVVNAPPDLPRC